MSRFEGWRDEELWHVQCSDCDQITMVEPDENARMLFFLCDHCGMEAEAIITAELMQELQDSRPITDTEEASHG